MAANEMAKDPTNAKGNFIPRDKKSLILHASNMIGPTRSSLVEVLRFEAPTQPGVYPYVCTFPGHWVVMNGVMVVAEDAGSADALLAESVPKTVKTVDDRRLRLISIPKSVRTRCRDGHTRGMTAFVKARCNQCHIVAGHGVNLGPDLAESVKKLRGRELLLQMIDPSSKIHEDYQNFRFLLDDGRVLTGVIVKEDKKTYSVATNLLTPNSLTQVRKKDIEEKLASKVSPMPNGMLDVLTKDEIFDLHAFVQSGGYNLPEHLRQHHKMSKE